MHDDLPDPRRSEDGSYDAFLREIGERAVATAEDNARDMGKDPEDVEAHVGIALATYVETELERGFPEFTDDDPVGNKFARAAYIALFDDALEAARDVAEEQGYTVYIPRDEVEQ